MRKLVLAMSLVLAGAVSAQAGSLQNGGFEAGMDKWKSSSDGAGWVGVVTDFGVWGPYEGQNFAWLKTDGAGNLQTLWQKINLNAGDVVSFRYFFSEDNIYEDIAGAELLDKDKNPAVAGLMLVGDAGETNPPGTWEYFAFAPVPANGKYILGFGVANVSGSSTTTVDSYLGVDAVNVNSGYEPDPQPMAPIPEPLTMLGVSLGAAGLAGYIRKRLIA